MHNCKYTSLRFVYLQKYELIYLNLCYRIQSKTKNYLSWYRLYLVCSVCDVLSIPNKSCGASLKLSLNKKPVKKI